MLPQCAHYRYCMRVYLRGRGARMLATELGIKVARISTQYFDCYKGHGIVMNKTSTDLHLGLLGQDAESEF